MTVYRLENALQRYDWGSTSALQGVLGLPVDGRPAAELWLGAHPQGPSVVHLPGGRDVGLAELIRADPYGVMGAGVVDAYGPRLPYLLKLLAADRALSLQVHPQPHRARAGFNAENRRGIALDDPQRTYRDDQAKPEMVVALSRFEVLSGFRRPQRILTLLDGLPGDLVAGIRAALQSRPTAAGISRAFALAVRAGQSSDGAADLALTVAAVADRLEAGSDSPRADETVVALAEQHPGDPGAVVSLMLNRLTLRPGEAMFVPSGHVHAYLSGCAVEVMASSDNVLRAGLTHKRVDVDALLDCAVFQPGPAARPRMVPLGGDLVSYRAKTREFGLVVGRPGADATTLPTQGPRVLVVVDGEVEVTTSGGVQTFTSGESVVVPHSAGSLTVRGGGLLALSYVP
ncbi:mannose-6-phosphate isomerase, class I [Paraoerskovia marina]|uniref:mannose-6-phosphate isomerase, class I n=1 Tax=Paraoerskovia marina TaxID=545619 RepID=UPI0004929F4A|nr:mannose-6-phosphate isomerase, class I [Paraoerskovia marina]